MANINKDIDKIIVVDPGKNTVNALCFDPNFTLIGHVAFPSITKKKRSFRDIDGSSELQFQYERDGVRYLVGEGVLGGFDFQTSKNTTHHKICVETAISYFVGNEEEHVHLVVGYPSSDFTNPEQQKEYINLLNEKEPVHLNLDGMDKSYTLVNLVVKPEGIAMKPRVDQIAKERVKIIDIGGENINYRYYDEKGNTLENESVDKLGVNHLESFIRTRLRKYIKINQFDVESVDYMNAVKSGRITGLKNDDIADFKDSKEFINETVLDFVDMIIEGLDAKGVSLYKRGAKILFTGGGSILLRPYLEETLENTKDHLVFSNTAYWDNCISYAIKDVGDRYKEADGDKMENMQMAQMISNKMLKEANQLAI